MKRRVCKCLSIKETFAIVHFIPPPMGNVFSVVAALAACSCMLYYYAFACLSTISRLLSESTAKCSTPINYLNVWGEAKP